LPVKTGTINNAEIKTVEVRNYHLKGNVKLTIEDERVKVWNEYETSYDLHVKLVTPNATESRLDTTEFSCDGVEIGSNESQKVIPSIDFSQVTLSRDTDSDGVFDSEQVPEKKILGPVAKAKDVRVTTQADSAKITLDASESYSPTGKKLTYSWENLPIEGEFVSKQPTIEVEMPVGKWLGKLRVSDREREDTAQFTINVVPMIKHPFIETTLSVDPVSYSGPCPATIKFKGEISVTQPGRVQYKFIRSDGARAPLQTLNFEKSGSKEVSTTWAIGRDYSGWMAIKVLYPQEAESNKAVFNIKCVQRKLESEKIEEATLVGKPKRKIRRKPLDLLQIKQKRQQSVTGSPARIIPILPLAENEVTQWTNGNVALTFPGAEDDSRGFACYRNETLLEDDKFYPKALETHPEWRNIHGLIVGIFKIENLPENAIFKTKVGFLKGADNTDGVKFKVYARSDPTFYTAINAYYDGKLDDLAINLSRYAGQDIELVLQVHVLNNSAQDWAVWIDPRIEW